MEITVIYAVVLSGICLGFLVVAQLSVRRNIIRTAYMFILKSVAYTFILHRHRWIGPWTVGAFMLQVSYIIANFVCIVFRVSSFADAGIRAGRLSMVNMIPLFLGPHLGFLADLLGMPVRAFHKVHCSCGAMSTGLMVFHAGVTALMGELQDAYVSAVQRIHPACQFAANAPRVLYPSPRFCCCRFPSCAVYAMKSFSGPTKHSPYSSLFPSGGIYAPYLGSHGYMSTFTGEYPAP
jgi:hypothetical protein